MRSTKLRKLSIFLTAAMVLGSVYGPINVRAAEVEAYSETISGTTVTTSDEFLTALSQKKSPIIVNGKITIQDGTEESGRMLPVKIPADTVITGTEGSSINSRSPIQLEGDHVTFKDIELTFDSSDALGSVPHREIFLAGHSLTFDNVSTYLEGSGGSLGQFGSSEEELLPSVYAGGYPGTTVGTDASFTVINSNDKTMFKGIYMGYEAASEDKVAYTGESVLNLDTKVIVREGVRTTAGSKAEVNVSGDGSAKTTAFYGNENTTLTLKKCSMYGAVVTDIGNLILDQNALLASQTDTFSNVTITNNACLDLNDVAYATVKGDFTGDTIGTTENLGVLVLESQGELTIEGTVTGVTRFQTSSYQFPGTIYAGREYIKAKQAEESEINFILSEKDSEYGFELSYDEDGWWVYLSYGDGVIPSVGKVDIVSAPTAVDLADIRRSFLDDIPEDAVFMEMYWYDEDGNPFSREVLDWNVFYAYNRIIIKTDYLNSTDAEVQARTDWSNAIALDTDEEKPDLYYLRAEESAVTGNYTILFCKDEPPELSEATVADVQNLRDTVVAEWQITFYDSAAAEAGAVDISGEGFKAANIAEQSYTGSMITPTVQLNRTVDGETAALTEGVDYVVNYENNIEVGDQTAVAKIAGIGNYKGEIVIPFSIVKGTPVITLTGNDVTELKVQYEDKIRFVAEISPWKENSTELSYVKFYCGDTLLGTAAIHDGRAVFNYYTTEQKIPVGDSEISVQFDGTTELNSGTANMNVTLEKEEDTPSGGEGGDTPSGGEGGDDPSGGEGGDDPSGGGGDDPFGGEEGDDPSGGEEGDDPSGGEEDTSTDGSETGGDAAVHVHSYETIIQKATPEKDGSIVKQCTVCKEIAEQTVINHPAEVVLEKDTYTYDKKAKKPGIVIKDAKGNVIDAANYAVTYANNKNVGKANVTIYFTGNYEGTLAKQFTILPKTTSLSKVKLTAKGITVKWKKQRTQTSGYMIQYSTSSKFTKKTTKTVTIKSNKTTTKTIRIKKPKKKYYVRICTYKTVKVNGKNQKICAKWSNAKRVK